MMPGPPVLPDSMKRQNLLPFLIFGLLAAPIPAAITYVDATLDNTDIASGGADSLWADGDDGTTGGTVADGSATNDGLWRFRSGFGNGGIWEATGTTATAEDAVEIVTSATVANGIYDVFVFYYAVNDNGDFPIRAGLSSGTHTVFDRVGNKGTAGQDSSTLAFGAGVAPPTNGESRTLLYGLVGQTTVSDGTLNVYIDDFPASSTGTSNDRTWYQGIGYEVIPEPSAAVLSALGTLALLGRRRR